MLCSTPESRCERQPLAAEDGLCLTFDGRLDNRADLARELAGADLGLALDTDADLVLASYRRWGEDCFRRLLGDFAAAVWDPEHRKLVCARDIVGVRPLYYYRDERQFVCGSEPQQLFAAASIRPEPNEAMYAEYLSFRMTSREETLYRGVFRLPAAHLLIVDARGLETRRYYEPDPAFEVHYPSDAGYAEHFLQLFGDAIACRLRSDTPIAGELSGGLDSSSVVCLAEDLRRRGAVPDFRFLTISMVTPGFAGDETPYVNAVAARWQLESCLSPPGAPDPDGFVDQIRRYRDFPNLPNVAASDGLLEVARARGCRVALTGTGGDDWLSATYSHGAELLRRGRIGEFLNQVYTDSESGAWRSRLKTGMMMGVWPLLPDAAQAAVATVRRRPLWPAYLTPEFVAATDLKRRFKRPRADDRCATLSRRELLDWFQDGRLAYGQETDDRQHAWFGVEARHPFHDRRLVEFMLAIPEEQRWRSTATKFVLRQAMSGLLPAEIQTRTTKGDYSHIHMAAFEACGGEACFDSMEMARRGWVCQPTVVEMYRDMHAAFCRRDPSYATHALRLWMVYGLELLLRHGYDAAPSEDRI